MQAAGSIVRALPASKTDTVSVLPPAKPSTKRERKVEEAGLTGHVEAGTLTAEQADDIVAAGLETSVLAGTTTPAAAADHAAAEREAARPPTRREKAASELATLRAELADANARIDELVAAAEFRTAEGSEHAHEREAMFTRQQATISALRSSVAELTTKHADLLGAHKGPLRRPGLRIGTVSVTREKAGELLTQCREIAEASELAGLEFMRTPSPGMVRGADSTTADFLSADKSSGHASGFDLSIVDELGLMRERDHALVTAGAGVDDSQSRENASTKLAKSTSHATKSNATGMSASSFFVSAAASRARPPAVTRSGYALVDSGRYVCHVRARRPTMAGGGSTGGPTIQRRGRLGGRKCHLGMAGLRHPRRIRRLRHQRDHRGSRTPPQAHR